VPDIPQLTEGQDVIDEILNAVHDSDEEEDGDCILQNGIDAHWTAAI